MLTATCDAFMGFCFLGIFTIAVWRARVQGTAAPELRHVLPTGFGCLISAVGFFIRAMEHDFLGALLGALGMLIAAGAIVWNRRHMAEQPVAADVERLREERDELREIKRGVPEAEVRDREHRARARALRDAIVITMRDDEPSGIFHAHAR